MFFSDLQKTRQNISLNCHARMTRSIVNHLTAAGLKRTINIFIFHVLREV